MVLDRPVDPAYDHIRGPVDAPVAITRDRRVLRHPTEEELAAALDLDS